MKLLRWALIAVVIALALVLLAGQGVAQSVQGVAQSVWCAHPGSVTGTSAESVSRSLRLARS